MKIVNNYKPKTTRFCDLEDGVVFMCEDTLYMKLRAVAMPNCPIVFNAVSLASGIIATIVAIKPVQPVDGEFVVKKVNA